MENYLQSGTISSNFFESDIPPQTWTPAVYRRMLSCCEKLGYHTHAAILCQFLQPVDYELAFGILKNNVESTVDSLFIHFWDMTIIEYLICILNAVPLTSLLTSLRPIPSVSIKALDLTVFIAEKFFNATLIFCGYSTFSRCYHDASAYP